MRENTDQNNSEYGRFSHREKLWDMLLQVFDYYQIFDVIIKDLFLDGRLGSRFSFPLFSDFCNSKS